MDDFRDFPVSLFGGKFQLQMLIGSGGFGSVYMGIETATNTPVAVKMERTSASTRAASFLFHEARVMQEIQKIETKDKRPAIAMLKYFGQEGKHRLLIMQLMGPSLEDLMERRRRFSLKTTLMLGIQMVSRVEFMHSCGFLHRDLKPDNFVLGLGADKRRLYIIDFGLSTRYINSEGQIRPEMSDKPFIGTARYASARTHLGFSQGRRDDLEQLVYVLVYLYRGRLPWSGLQVQHRAEKENKIGTLKRTLELTEICQGCPHFFVLLLNYVRKIRFDETPQYDMITGLLVKGLEDINEKCDNIFDWDVPATSGGAFKNTDDKVESNPDIDGNLQSDAEACGILSGNESQDITSLEG